MTLIRCVSINNRINYISEIIMEYSQKIISNKVEISLLMLALEKKIILNKNNT